MHSGNTVVIGRARTAVTHAGGMMQGRQIVPGQEAARGRHSVWALPARPGRGRLRRPVIAVCGSARGVPLRDSAILGEVNKIVLAVVNLSFAT